MELIAISLRNKSKKASPKNGTSFLMSKIRISFLLLGKAS